MEVVLELARDRVEPVDPSSVCTYPQFLIGCLRDTEYIVVAKTIALQRMAIVHELAGISFIDVHASCEGAQPHIAYIVFVCRMDRVVAETGRVDVIVKIMPEGIGSRIVNIEPCILQSYPEIMLWPFSQPIDDISGQSPVVTGSMFEMMKVVADAGAV
jgi:hypothetical protein